MNRFSLLFIGFTFTFFSSWIGLVVAPINQFGVLQPVPDPDKEGSTLPPDYSALAQKGREVYTANGCIYCHSQQIRGKGQGADMERGWGPRNTVARDYVHDRPVFLGTMRTGPDLTNIGARQNSAAWHYEHLYSPQAMSEASIMPPFRHLFTLQKITGQPSTEALKFPEGKGVTIPSGYEIVPTDEARALVAYLLSLKHTYPLQESPIE